MMAAPPSDHIIGRITTQEIGDLLDNDFPDHLDVPIDYFYLQIRKEYVSKAKKLRKHDPTVDIERLVSQQDTGIESIKKVISGRKWPSTYFVKFPKVKNRRSQRLETLREQEKRLNTSFRLPLKRTIDQQLRSLLRGRNLPNNPPVVHIIITRVCKYTHHQGNDM